MIKPEESEKIRELRDKLPENLLRKDQYEDDYFLVRWLRARNYDVEKAFEMLQKSLQWRKEMQADTVLDKEDIPQEFRKQYPTAFLGRDSEDCVAVLLPLGRYNHRRLFGDISMETALKYNMMWMEKMMRLLRETEEETGKKGIRLIEVVDMKYYSYKELTYAPAREFILKTNKNCEDNYPEMLKSCIIINAPRIFAMLFSFVKPFMSKETLSKVDVYGGGPENEEVWKELLRSRLNSENIPIHWGGTRQGSNEYCSDDPSVWMDAPIPLSFFTNEKGDSEFKTQRVAARDKFQIDIPVKREEGSPQLHWKVKIDSHDIGFGVSFTSSGSKEATVILPTKRFDSKHGVHEGSLTQSKGEDGIYTIIFDNKYSLARAKVVHYSIQLIHVQDLQNENS